MADSKENYYLNLGKERVEQIDFKENWETKEKCHSME